MTQACSLCFWHHIRKLDDHKISLCRWFSIPLLPLQNLQHGFVWHENRGTSVIKQALRVPAERPGHVTSKRWSHILQHQLFQGLASGKCTSLNRHRLFCCKIFFALSLIFLRFLSPKPALVPTTQFTSTHSSFELGQGSATFATQRAIWTHFPQ